MGEVLSQNEIDNILEALSTGDLVTGGLDKASRVKKYDFAKPAKFSKEHLRTLDIIFEHYARLLETHLPVYMRKSVQVKVSGAEAVTYSEFSNSLSSPILFGIVGMEPFDGEIILAMDASLGYMFIDRMLGGTGSPLDKVKDFSDVEIAVLERVYDVCLGLLKEPWDTVVTVDNVELKKIETNAQFAQICSPTEIATLVVMEVVMGDKSGKMMACIPFSSIDRSVDKLNMKAIYSNMKYKNSEDYRDIVEASVSKAQVPVKVVLGQSVISLVELATLQRGDIIKLDSSVQDELDVYVGNVHKFKAVAGAAKDSYAVKIKSVIREEE